MTLYLAGFATGLVAGGLAVWLALCIDAVLRLEDE